MAMFVNSSVSAPSPEVLVLDSTELASAWLLRGRVWDLTGSIPGLSVAVPACVRVETVANHRRAVEESRANLLKLMRRRHELGFTPSIVTDDAPDYEYDLEMAFDSRGVEVLPWPTVNHEDIVVRAVSRTPPFDSRGGGYRDTLVWFSVLALAEAGHTVQLASRDRAFAGSGDVLHPDLFEETRDLRGTVNLVRNLGAWIVERAAGHAPGLVSSDVSERRYDEFVNYTGQWGFEDAWLTSTEVGLPPESERVALIQFVESDDWEVVRDRELLGGGSYVEFAMPSRLRLEAEVPIAFAIERGWDYEGVSAAGYVTAEFEMDVHIGAEVIFARDGYGMEIQTFKYTRRPAHSYPWNRTPEDSN